MNYSTAMNDQEGSSIKAGRYDAVLREAAQRLADALAPYRVLTRADLAELARVKRWRGVNFDAALDCAVELGLLRRLKGDLYEIPRDQPAG